MGLRKLIFPIALAIVWVAMAAMAMVDFASFAATTQPKPAVAQQKHSVRPQGRIGTRLALH